MDGKKTIIFAERFALIVLAIALVISMPFSAEIELALGLRYKVKRADAAGLTIVKKLDNGLFLSATGGESLNVHFVDVGQADCTVIELPDGKTMLIDGGDDNKKTETAISTFVTKTLPADFKYFDYAVLTHPDSDHCGSFDYVLDTYPARIVYRPNVEAVGTTASPYVDPGKSKLTSDARSKNTQAYAKAVKAMYKTTADFTSEVRVTDPDKIEYDIKGGSGDGAYSLTFYSPLSDKYTREGEWNNYSPIMILEYRGYKYAMSGDAEVDNLNEFVAKVNGADTDGVTDKYDGFGDNYCVNVIKAGHHGSGNATTASYLETITSPVGASVVYCVISCGEGNSYGHPHKAALDRYAAIGLPSENILRTDEKGDITLGVRVGEDGTYGLFYGDKKQNSGAPTGGDYEGEANVPEYVYVYRRLGDVDLTWHAVGWTIYAVLVALSAAHTYRLGRHKA